MEITTIYDDDRCSLPGVLELIASMIAGVELLNTHVLSLHTSAAAATTV